jgi:hypothetical protein
MRVLAADALVCVHWPAPVQVYLDAGDAKLRVLLFRSTPGGPPPQLCALDDDEPPLDVSTSVGKCQAAHDARILAGDADERVQHAAVATLRQLSASADAAAGAAALRRRFGASSHVAHAALPLHAALSAHPRSVVRLDWHGSTFVVWHSASESSLATLWRELASARGARFAAVAVIAVLGAAYSSACALPAGGSASGVCIIARQLLAPSAGLFLMLSLLNSRVGRSVRGALTAARRQHAE